MSIKTSDIKPNPDIPTDKKFGELYKAILLGQLDYYDGIIDIQGIKPFSDYKPKPKTADIHYILKRIQNHDYPRIHLYQEGEVFIMSDDYNTYYTYLELELKEIPSLIMGEPTGKYVIKKNKIPNPKELTAVVLEEPQRN